VSVVIVISHLGIDQGVSRFTAGMVKSRHRIPVIDIPEVTLTGCVKETARWLTQDRYAAGRLVDLMAQRGDLDGLLP
jgi:hypothetical protein